MQIPCSFNLHLVSLSFSPSPKSKPNFYSPTLPFQGQIRFSLERKQKSTFSKIHKLPLSTSTFPLNQLIHLKTTLKNLKPYNTQNYQKKFLSFRIFYRNSKKEVKKFKEEIDITGVLLKQQEKEREFVVDFGESEEGLGGRVMRVRYEVDVKLEHLMKRLSLELPLGECVLTGNMFSEEGILESNKENRQYCKDDNHQQKQRNKQKQRENRQLITSLKNRIQELQSTIITLQQQLRHQKHLNLQISTSPDSESQPQPLSQPAKLPHPTLSELQLSLTKYQAIQATHLQTISSLKQEIEQLFKFQLLNKNLQLELSEYKEKYYRADKELREVTRVMEVRIEEGKKTMAKFEDTEGELIKAKLMLMRVWNEIQEKGGVELFETISAKIME